MRSFKLCMVTTLLGVYIDILGLMTLALFQGHRYVRNIYGRLCFLDSCPLLQAGDEAVSMLCVTVVHLKDITNMFSPVLHLNVSHLSICSSCFMFTVETFGSYQPRYGL